MQTRCRTRGEERRQADGVHGAAVQQAQQRARHVLLPCVRTRRQQHPARRVRRRRGPLIAALSFPILVTVAQTFRSTRRCGLCAINSTGLATNRMIPRECVTEPEVMRMANGICATRERAAQGRLHV